MDAADRELFAASLRGVVADHTGAPLDAALADLGWSEALSSDPEAAVSLLFELQGSANATSSALDRVVLSALEVTEPAAVVLPWLRSWEPPGDVAGEGVAVRGLGTPGLSRCDRVAVVAGSSDGPLLVEVAVRDLELRPVGGLDPALGLVEVTGGAVPAVTRPGGAWVAAVAAGQRAVAHELVGTARTMLRLACDHALDRIQFGQPIARFQAVRHRLAESLVAIEAADGALAAAWRDGTPLTASLAKALAGRGARVTAKHCQQVLAGVGFTTEHDLHRYVRRALVLDAVLGDARTLTHHLGTELLRTRSLPDVLPL
jgi:hypothetical protein